MLTCEVGVVVLGPVTVHCPNPEKGSRKRESPKAGKIVSFFSSLVY